MIFDFCIVGGGIVGLATALRLSELRPDDTILVLEKEKSVAQHQTGHNSGVIHAGIYYAPGSLKAELCRLGNRATKEFCTEHDIPFEVCGKLVVATNDVELQRLEALRLRAIQNEIEVDPIGASRLREIEPMIDGVGGLLVPSTGIVDYKRICAKIAEIVATRGGTILFGRTVTSIKESGEKISIDAGGERFEARQLIACAGLQADRIAQAAGIDVDFQIVPFRGEYYRLPAAKNSIVKHLIYPVPDPDLPFLGIHLTRMIDGSVTVGPNAVLGMAREGYAKFSVNPRDLVTYLGFPGFWRVMGKNLRSGLKEMRDSLWPAGYLAMCRKYCPSLTIDDLLPMEAGIRAQAVLKDGTLVHDFLFKQTDRMLHVINAPSPAATSAMPIGSIIADRVLRRP